LTQFGAVAVQRERNGARRAKRARGEQRRRELAERIDALARRMWEGEGGGVMEAGKPGS
jgi:hypothetical protein